MKQSLQRLMERLPEEVDGAIIASDRNRRYFTDMRSSAGTLLVTRNAACLIIDFRYIEKARRVVRDIPVELQTDVYAQAAAFFAHEGVRRVAVETDSMTVETFRQYTEKLPGITLSNDGALSRLIGEMRSVKTAEELSFIRQAQAITDEVFSGILEYIRPGVSEQEIAVEMEYQMRRRGASGVAFDTIVASGVNSSMPHAVPSSKKIEAGDFVTMDFGAAYEGYCSDMTRTVAVGQITPEQRRVYDTVLQAQKMAIEAIPHCRRYNEIDQVARDYIYEQGYEGCFGHSLGHSLGLFIHESPGFSVNCREEMQPGVVVTVEPGVYLEGKFGVRIENMVLLQENGAEDLTHSPRELILL